MSGCGQTRAFLWSTTLQPKKNKQNVPKCLFSLPTTPSSNRLSACLIQGIPWTSQPSTMSPLGSSCPGSCVKETSKPFDGHFGTSCCDLRT